MTDLSSVRIYGQAVLFLRCKPIYICCESIRILPVQSSTCVKSEEGGLPGGQSGGMFQMELVLEVKLAPCRNA